MLSTPQRPQLPWAASCCLSPLLSPFFSLSRYFPPAFPGLKPFFPSSQSCTFPVPSTRPSMRHLHLWDLCFSVCAFATPLNPHHTEGHLPHAGISHTKLLTSTKAPALGFFCTRREWGQCFIPTTLFLLLGAMDREEEAASKSLADAGKRGKGWREGKGTPGMLGCSSLFCLAQQGGRAGMTLTAVSSSLSSELQTMMSSAERRGQC